MNSDYEKHLETAIDRELKGLTEMPAPETLIPRVMQALERQAASARRPQGWRSWPAPLQAAALVFLLAIFGGICFAAGNVAQVTNLLAEQSARLTGWNAISNTASALGGAMMAIIKQLGPGFIIAGLIVAIVSYVACVGLGTVFARMIAPQRNQL